MIVATRPVALYVFRAQRDARLSTTPANIPDNVQTLADACVRCARYSCSILLDSWLDGSFLTFEYFSTLYLFSAGSVLALSSQMKNKGSYKDREDFELASQLMTELKQSGNMAAVEFSRHFGSMESFMSSGGGGSTPLSGQGNAATGPQASDGSTGSGHPSSDAPMNRSAVMTAGMALAEPSMQAFLSLPEPNFQHMDMSFLQNDFDGFYWPDS
jgi:proline utilization trans-activator